MLAHFLISNHQRHRSIKMAVLIVSFRVFLLSFCSKSHGRDKLTAAGETGSNF